MVYRCIYCGTSLTHTSFQAKRKHLNGKKHRERVAEYWLRVGKHLGKFHANASIDNPQNLRSADLDQTAELNVFKIPGLDPDAEKLVPGTLPPPANIPTQKFTKSYLTG